MAHIYSNTLIATVRCGGPGLKIPNRKQLVKLGVRFVEMDNRSNKLSPVGCYSLIDQEQGDGVEFIIYTHDDLTIHSPTWFDEVMSLFAGVYTTHPDTVAVGLGGALGLGHKDLYKKPYRLDDMARQHYMSNSTDAEVHGERIDSVQQAAVLDAYFIAVRRSFLHSVGGWPKELTHHCLDLWLACEAARHNKLTLVCPVSCTHAGGGTSIKAVYRDATWLQGQTLDSDHQAPHHFIYSQYRDVLPILPTLTTTQGIL